MFDFPNNPTTNQQVTAGNGVTYVYDGTKWLPNTLASSTTVPFLPLAGGSMLGPITLLNNATQNLQAVPLQQLNTTVNNTVAGYLPLTGGTLASPGNLTVNGTTAAQAVTATAVTASGTVQGANVTATSTVTGGYVHSTGATQTDGASYTNGASYFCSAARGNGFYAYDDGNAAFINWSSNWGFAWRHSDGITGFFSPSGWWQWYVDGSGNSTQNGTCNAGYIYSRGNSDAAGSMNASYIHSTGNVQADGSLTANGDVSVSGTCYATGIRWPGNSAYGWFRGGDGRWNFIDNNNTWFQLIPAGGFRTVRTTGSNIEVQSSDAWYCWNDGNQHWIYFSGSSDERVKTVLGPYTRGLDELRRLEPVVYRYKGNIKDTLDGSKTAIESGHPEDTEVLHAGIVAQHAERHFPEIVARHEMIIDGKRVDDARRQAHPEWLDWATVNAIKELADRLEALERKA